MAVRTHVFTETNMQLGIRCQPYDWTWAGGSLQGLRNTGQMSHASGHPFPQRVHPGSSPDSKSYEGKISGRIGRKGGRRSCYAISSVDSSA